MYARLGTRRVLFTAGGTLRKKRHLAAMALWVLGTTGAATLLFSSTAAAQQEDDRTAQASKAMELGSQAMARGEFEVAIGFFRAAKVLLPDASGPRLALGLALRANLQCREALSE